MDRPAVFFALFAKGAHPQSPQANYFCQLGNAVRQNLYQPSHFATEFFTSLPLCGLVAMRDYFGDCSSYTMNQFFTRLSPLETPSNDF